MHGGSLGQRCQLGGSFTQHDDRCFIGNIYCYPHCYLIVQKSWGIDLDTKAHSRQYQIVDGYDKLVKALSQ